MTTRETMDTNKSDIKSDDLPDALTEMNDRTNLLKEKGDLDGAEMLGRRTLEMTEKEFGSENLHTFRAMANLGNILRMIGAYEEAETFVRRGLAGFEKMEGVAYYLPWAMHMLGTLLTEKGDLDEAEEILRRALEEYQGNRFEDDSTPEDRETLECVMHLGRLLRQKADELSDENDEIETLYRRALSGLENLLGAEHPDTLTCMDELATVLSDKGKADACEVLLRRLLERREKVLGPEHPDTLRNLHNLGCLLCEKGDKAAAEALFRRALKGEEKKLGIEHPYTLRTSHALGSLLCEKGENDEAAALYCHALKDLKKALESDYRKTIKIVNDYCSLLTRQGDSSSAVALYLQTITWVNTVLGADHFISPILADKLAALGK
jgi:tetratricopeptide (TPR) repeat protein